MVPFHSDFRHGTLKLKGPVDPRYRSRRRQDSRDNKKEDDILLEMTDTHDTGSVKTKGIYKIFRYYTLLSPLSRIPNRQNFIQSKYLDPKENMSFYCSVQTKTSERKCFLMTTYDPKKRTKIVLIYPLSLVNRNDWSRD